MSVKDMVYLDKVNSFEFQPSKMKLLGMNRVHFVAMRWETINEWTVSKLNLIKNKSKKPAMICLKGSSGSLPTSHKSPSH